MNKKNTPIWAIKLKNFFSDNGYTAKDIADILKVQPTTIYSYISGKNQMNDEFRKILEKEIKLPIYDIFYNPLFDKVATITYIKRGVDN